MRHDLRKTLLTMAGMAWGIATVVLLLAYGNGFGTAIENIFQSFGATAVGIFPGRTSQQAGGNKAGVQIRFTNDDIELLRNNVPLCKHVVRMSEKDSSVQNGNRTFTMPVNGLDPAIEEIWNLDIGEGRFLDDADNSRHGLVAVIGSEAKDKLFSGAPALGENIRINGVEFQVIGVVTPRMQEGDDDDNRTIYIPYNSMNVLKDNHYLDGIWMDSQGLDHDKLDETIRATLAAAHNFKSRRYSAHYSSVRCAKATIAVWHYFSGAESSAGVYRNADAGNRRRGVDEHDAGFGDPTHARDRRREGVGRATARHFVPVSGGGDGDYRRWRDARNCAVLCGIGLVGTADFLQRDGKACRGCGHPADRFADDPAGGNWNSGGGGCGERYGSGDARGESGSDRSLALRVGRAR